VPYRTLPKSEPDLRPFFENDADLVVLSAIVWTSSLLRVAVALLRAEPFETEPALAVLLLVTLPLLLAASIVWKGTR